MKKVLLLLVCLFTLQTVVWADDDKPIQVNQLPQTAQTFYQNSFPPIIRWRWLKWKQTGLIKAMM